MKLKKGAIFLNDSQYQLFIELLECIDAKINNLDRENKNGGLPEYIDEQEVFKWQRLKSSEILERCEHVSAISN